MAGTALEMQLGTMAAVGAALALLELRQRQTEALVALAFRLV
jgi:hypothetical protein